METFVVPWWGWLVLIVLIAIWMVIIGIIMEMVRWISEMLLGEFPESIAETKRKERPH